MSLFVLFYESADDVMTRAAAVYPAHAEHVDQFVTAGELLAVGTFADPQADGAMSVFRSRDAAERFAASDPFVAEGVVASWTIKEWNEITGAL
jgi:uncharacterized protein YciI